MGPMRRANRASARGPAPNHNRARSNQQARNMACGLDLTTFKPRDPSLVRRPPACARTICLALQGLDFFTQTRPKVRRGRVRRRSSSLGRSRVGPHGVGTETRGGGPPRGADVRTNQANNIAQATKKIQPA